MGGISGLDDALEFLMAGASAIQVGTAIFASPGMLVRLIDELEAWMTRHGVASLREIVGTANPGFRTHDRHELDLVTGYLDE